MSGQALSDTLGAHECLCKACAPEYHEELEDEMLLDGADIYEARSSREAKQELKQEFLEDYRVQMMTEASQEVIQAEMAKMKERVLAECKERIRAEIQKEMVEELEQELKERDAEIVSLKGQVARAEGKVVLLAISMEGTYRTCSWLKDNLSKSLKGLDYFVKQVQQKPLGTTAEEEKVKHAIFVMSEYEDQKTETMAPFLKAMGSLWDAFPALGSRMFHHDGDVRTRNAEMQEWIERKTTPGEKLEDLDDWPVDQHGEPVSDEEARVGRLVYEST